MHYGSTIRGYEDWENIDRVMRWYPSILVDTSLHRQNCAVEHSRHPPKCLTFIWLLPPSLGYIKLARYHLPPSTSSRSSRSRCRGLFLPPRNFPLRPWHPSSRCHRRRRRRTSGTPPLSQRARFLFRVIVDIAIDDGPKSSSWPSLIIRLASLAGGA